MKKVLMLVNHDVVIYNFRRELVERLLHDGYEVYISSPYGERIDRLIDMGCKYIETKIARHGKNPIEDLKLILEYRKMIKKIHPNIILTYTIKPNIYGGIASRMMKVKYIANITGLGTAVEHNGIMQKITLGLYKIAFKNIHCVFFQNEENKEFFEKRNICNRKYRLIPGSGVNLEQFKLLEYPDDRIVEFAFISRIMKEKGIDQYLETAKVIREKYPNTVFHVCGFCEEEYEEKLKEYQREKIIIYHGMVSDVREILKKVHCVIHPSYYPEGMSNVLLESAATGRILITTDRSGCKEIVDMGVNGFIIGVKNKNQLIKSTERVIGMNTNERKKMGIEGRKKIEAEFNRNKIIEAYIEEIV